MQDKHKVTLYLPPELHRQLKIRSAVELEPMSTIAERAIVFYLEHSDVVEEVEAAHGHTHKVYACPECASSLVMRQGEMTSVVQQPTVLLEDGTSSANVSEDHSDSDQESEQGELVPLLG
ncbi:hypothetical protein [Egbenema bharatensis]|uniref:hypothetical protein n=1 Tax=Egbenema bharatensis TaxID=3463334 RepID=UPI003A86241E